MGDAENQDKCVPSLTQDWANHGSWGQEAQYVHANEDMWHQLKHALQNPAVDFGAATGDWAAPSLPGTQLQVVEAQVDHFLGVQLRLNHILQHEPRDHCIAQDDALQGSRTGIL